ncbi:MAG: hypothetical protein ABMA26_10185 [Limisphaerales bacterium]
MKIPAVLAVLWLCGVATSALGAGAASDAQAVFERRILPIFKSPNPSSCTECHLAGVDLKSYILPSHEKTFLSLRDQGLVDLDSPADSKILRLIARGGGTNQGASLISAKVREAELAAFTEWITASARDPKLRGAAKLSAAEVARPARPLEVIRHARTDRLLASFEENIWSQRFRCNGCHSPAGKENAKLVAEHGEQVAWLKDTPEATMRYLIATENINLRQPERSRLLLKPLNEIKHGGGQKMLAGDLTYKAFRAWLDDYARTVTDRYASAADLPSRKPAPAMFGTDLWLKLNNTPPEWGDRLLQVTLFAWDRAIGAWESKPIAISDRAVWGKGKLWQHSLALLADKDSERARLWAGTGAGLPSGKYLLKVHVDVAGRLKSDWNATLGEAELVGEAAVESGWPKGYGKMTVVEAGLLRR